MTGLQAAVCCGVCSVCSGLPAHESLPLLRAQEPASLVERGRAPQRCRCNVPTNCTIAEGCSYEAATAQVEAAGLEYPLLAKPLWADGREGSHALAGARPACPALHCWSLLPPASKPGASGGVSRSLVGCGALQAGVSTHASPAAPPDLPAAHPLPAVVHTPAGLARLLAGEAPFLRPPLMLQQYVEHGGCLFKVYVLGDTSGEL